MSHKRIVAHIYIQDLPRPASIQIISHTLSSYENLGLGSILPNSKYRIIDWR
jgi:hypothetical protein